MGRRELCPIAYIVPSDYSLENSDISAASNEETNNINRKLDLSEYGTGQVELIYLDCLF